MTPIVRRYDTMTQRASTVRYALVAGSCALMHNGIVIGSTWAGAGVLGAMALSFCLMVVIGYLLLCVIVFRATPTRTGFMRYTLAMAASFPVTTTLLFVFAIPLHLPVAIASPLVTLLMIIVNFVAARWAIGRRATPCAF